MKLLDLHIPKLLIGLILLLLSGLLLKVEINILRQPHDILLHKLSEKEIWLRSTLINYVNRFELQNSRIPTPEEIDMWVTKYDKSMTYKVVSYQYLTSDYPAELTQVLGTGPQSGYVFSFKAPNRYVYYPSWNKDDEYGYILSSDYYLFGSKERAILFYGLLLILTWMQSFLLVYQVISKRNLTQHMNTRFGRSDDIA